MIRLWLTTFTFLLLLASRVRALSAIQGSPCYNICNGSSAATSSDIVCADSAFSNSTKGQLLENCLTCLHGSSYKSGSLTDSILFLYYVATVQQTCLSGISQIPTSTCSSRCSSLGTAFSNLGGQAFFTNTYAYCAANQSAYASQAPDCSNCLRSQPGSVILGNFVYVANYACSEQPSLSDGKSIDYSGNLFNYTLSQTSPTSMTSATATPSMSSSTSDAPSFTRSFATSTTKHPSSAPPTAHPNTDGSGGVAGAGDGSVVTSTTGGMKPGVAAAVGIIVGLIGVAMIVGLAILARRYQKERLSPMMRNNLGLTISNKAAALGATVEGSNPSFHTSGAGDKAAMAEAIRREAAAAAAHRR